MNKKKLIPIIIIACAITILSVFLLCAVIIIPIIVKNNKNSNVPQLANAEADSVLVPLYNTAEENIETDSGMTADTNDERDSEDPFKNDTIEYFMEHPDNTQYGMDLPDDIVLGVAGDGSDEAIVGIVYHTDDMPKDFLAHIDKNGDIWRLKQDLDDYIKHYNPEIDKMYDAYYGGGLLETTGNYSFYVTVKDYYGEGQDLTLHVRKDFALDERHRIKSDLTPDGTLTKIETVNALGEKITKTVSTY